MMISSWRERRPALLLVSLALFAAYLVTHPYRGVFSDALIYVTQAWAPEAILRGDMLFAHETQTGLTIFRPLMAFALKLMPVAEAARAVAFFGVAIWWVGLMTLFAALARAAELAPSAALAMAALVCIAPLGYSAGSTFMPGEFLAIPRPFAEGFALMGLAALLRGRVILSGAAFVAALAFHPLMGLAACAAAFVFVSRSDARIWAAAVFALLVAGVGALAGWPLFDRLTAPWDPAWRALLREHTSYLFMSEAPRP